MPLCNRVDPFGAIHAVAERGSLMGNRGMIHDPVRRTLLGRRWTTRAWIICLCDFKDRKRTPMGPGYTELFFLDEATALAAGHRPCFECQRGRAQAFAAAFAAGSGRTTIRTAEMDAILHRERLAAGAAPPALPFGEISSLPDGSIIALDGRALLVSGGQVRAWSFGGYGGPAPIDGLEGNSAFLLTPKSTVRALEAGFTARVAGEAAA